MCACILHQLGQQELFDSLPQSPYNIQHFLKISILKLLVMPTYIALLVAMHVRIYIFRVASYSPGNQISLSGDHHQIAISLHRKNRFVMLTENYVIWDASFSVHIKVTNFLAEMTNFSVIMTECISHNISVFTVCCIHTICTWFYQNVRGLSQKKLTTVSVIVTLRLKPPPP